MKQISIVKRTAVIAWFALVAFAVCSTFAVALAQQPKVAPPPNLADKGKLTYGVAATFPPFEYKDKGDFLGFDIEMAKALAASMNLDVEIIDMDFDGLIPALKGGRIDIINSAMYIKPEREQQVDFVPYMTIGEAIVVPAGNPKKIQSTDDLSGLSVAVTRGAVEEIYATEQNRKFAGEKKKPINILSLPTAPDSILAVQVGRADAFYTSLPGAAFIMTQKPGAFEIAGTFDMNTRIGIAVRKGDTAMLKAMQDAVKLFVESGSYEKLLQKYNLPAEANLFKK